MGLVTMLFPGNHGYGVQIIFSDGNLALSSITNEAHISIMESIGIKDKKKQRDIDI